MRLLSFALFGFLTSASFVVAADPVPAKDVTDNMRVRVVAARMTAARSNLGDTLVVRLVSVDDPKKEVVAFLFAAPAAATHENTLANVIRSATNWPREGTSEWQDATFELILSVPKDVRGRVKDCALWYVVSIKPLANR